MISTVKHPIKAFTLIALGLAILVMGIYVAEADDAPGAGGIGMILMVTAVLLGVRVARDRMSRWAARAAIAGGVVFAVLAALMTHGVVVTRPLFADAAAVPSTVASPASGRYATAIERARAAVRAAVLAQNLPGVSVAVALDEATGSSQIVWAEGFGWRDVTTQAPVTPTTRFHIGSAASVATSTPLPAGLTGTGADSAGDWSPEHIGEPEEDAPPLALLRRLVWQPLGLMPLAPLAGERATFYVPLSDNNPRRGRRLMYMRDLACCLNGKAFSSTPSDLARIALTTNAASVDGALAGGTVMSWRRAGTLVVAVTSNIAYADTPALASRVTEAFAAR